MRGSTYFAWSGVLLGIFAVQAGEAPRFELAEFLDVLGQSKSLKELTEKTSRLDLANRQAYGTFTRIQNSPVHAGEPQIVFKTGKAWIGTGAQFFDLIIGQQGEHPALYFQVTESEGRLVLNDDPALTAESIRSMDRASLRKQNALYAQKECASCHRGRLLLELADQPRSFSPQTELVFADDAKRQEFEKSRLASFQKFQDGPDIRTDPRYRWIFELPRVKERGHLEPEDLYLSRGLAEELVRDNAQEALVRLKSLRGFEEFLPLLKAALANEAEMLGDLAKKTGEEPGKLKRAYEETLLAQARSLLQFKRRRNAELVRETLGGERTSPVAGEAGGYLLLNRAAIRDIGFKIHELILPDDRYDALPAGERPEFLRRSELEVRDSEELARITAETRHEVEARAKATLVLDRLAGNRVEAKTLLSSSLRPSFDSAVGSGGILDLLRRKLDEIPAPPRFENDFPRKAGLDLSHKRPITLMGPLGDDTVIANFSYRGGFYVAEIPAGGVRRVALVTKNTAPFMTSAFLRFEFDAERPVRLVGRIGKTRGEVIALENAIELRNLLVSNEAIPFEGAEAYSLRSALAGKFTNVLRFLGAEEKLRDSRGVALEQHVFDLLPGEGERFLERALALSHAHGASKTHHPLFRNCASMVMRIAQEALAPDPSRAALLAEGPLDIARYNGASLAAFLRTRGVILDGAQPLLSEDPSLLVDLKPRRTSAPDARADCEGAFLKLFLNSPR